ncbi:hypothetical protein HHK36_020757 [Tetracentron sinense]|uniref:Transcription factor CBF/NF-Y/archaeal histone domain-containing protein n=1 Tax=Tetracentron sinense TaxID=13715 RepID=A0A835D946_TETSI|nr:hypothetical protein HHK36_020757 [Tetracentron sinense]
MLKTFKDKAMTKCSSFEAIVAYLWRARTKAVFDDPDEFSTVLFAVDIRSKLGRELDFGFGKPIHSWLVVTGTDEFVLLLSDANIMGNDSCLVNLVTMLPMMQLVPTCVTQVLKRNKADQVYLFLEMVDNIGSRPNSDGQKYKFSDASSASGADGSIKEQDRLLPIANVGRIMKQILPPNAKISKEAKETMQECVTEFISFVTAEASSKCHNERRKTVIGDDICWAMGSLGFDDYAESLRRYLHKYRESEGERANQNKPSNTEDEDEPSTNRGKQPSSQLVAPTPLKFSVIEKSNGSISRPF